MTSAILVVSQVALAVTVTIAAALLVRSVANLAAADGGFNRAHLATFLDQPSSQNAYAQAAVRFQFLDRTLGALRALPGVRSASAMSALPLERMLSAQVTDMEGYTATPDTTPEIVDYYQGVMTGYFDTMGIPIVRGRAFEPADARRSGPGCRRRTETLGAHLLEGPGPDRPAPASLLRRCGAVVHRRGRRARCAATGRGSQTRGRSYSVRRSDCPQLSRLRRRCIFMPLMADLRVDVELNLSADDWDFSLRVVIWMMGGFIPLTPATAGDEGECRGLRAAVIAAPRTAFTLGNSFEEIGIRMVMGANRSPVV